MLDAPKQRDDYKGWEEDSRHHSQTDSCQIASLIFDLIELIAAKFWSKGVKFFVKIAIGIVNY